MFIAEVKQRFRLDAPQNQKGEDTGAIGFKSQWQAYSDASKQVRWLKTINTGNWVTWQKQLAADDRADVRKELEAANVDTKSVNDVRSYFERKRQSAGAVILNTIRNVENEFSKRLGRPVKLEDINPYGKGLESETTREVNPFFTQFE